jgi:hypothetical protein
VGVDEGLEDRASDGVELELILGDPLGRALGDSEDWYSPSKSQMLPVEEQPTIKT